jgi:hypothetical protein
VKIPRLSSAVLVVTLAAALTGCGSSSDSKETGSGSGVKILSASQVGQAVIALEDLGPGFKVDKSDDGDDKSSFGCLDGLDKLDKNKIKPPQDEETDYAASSDIGIPAVFSKVGSFKDSSDASSILSKFKSAVQGCTSVDATDDDGFHVKLAITLDEKASGSGATAQVNMTAQGTGETSGQTFPFGIRMTAIQVDNNVSLVGFVTFGSSVEPEASKMAAIALERLVAVVGGKTPSPTPANLHVTTEDELLGSALQS